MSTRITRPSGRAGRLRSALLLVGLLAAGCGVEAGLPEGGTAVVAPDSEAARKAIAERDSTIARQRRQEQEANARRRLRSLPEPG